MPSNQVVAAPVRRAQEAVARAAQLHADAAEVVAVAVAVTSQIARQFPDQVGPRRDDAVLRPQIFTAANLTAVRQSIAEAAGRAGLHGSPKSQFVLAVYELLTNAVRHGGGWGRVTLRRDGELLVCTTTDFGPGFGDRTVPAGMPPATALGGRGLVMARRLTDSLHIRDGRTGTAVTVTMRIPQDGPGSFAGVPHG